MTISPQRVIRYTSCLVLGQGFKGRMALFLVTSNPIWRQAAIFDNFEWPYLRNGSFDRSAHRAVIFAIAQISCILDEHLIFSDQISPLAVCL